MGNLKKRNQNNKMRIAFVASCLVAASQAVATWDMDDAGNLVKPEMFVAIDRANLAQAARGRAPAKGKAASFWDQAKNFGAKAMAKGKEVWGDLKLTPADLGAVQKWTTDVGKTATACMKDWKTPACLVGATNNVLGAAKGIWSKANAYSANKKARLGKKAQVGSGKGGWLVQRANPDMFAEAQPVKNAKEASAAMKSALAGKPNPIAKEAAQKMAAMAKKGQVKAQVDRTKPGPPPAPTTSKKPGA